MMNPDFRKWLQQVDREIEKYVPLSREELPDRDYQSMWENGTTAAQAAHDALDYAGFFDEGGFDE